MKKITIEIPEYEPKNGIQYSWEYGFKIITQLSNDSIVIKANKQGLKSLAKQMLTLADLPEGIQGHLHYDDINSLEEGSTQLIVEKI